MPETPKNSHALRSHRHGRQKSIFKRYRGPVIAGILLILAIGAWLLVLRNDGSQRQENSPVAMTNVASSPAKTSGAQLVNLPADDAPHNNATEWWYYSGHLQTASGQRYAYHVTTFLRRTLVVHTIFHVSLVDLQTGKYYTDQARTAGIPSSVNKDGFDFSYQGWQVAGSGPNHKLNISTKDFKLALDLSDPHPPAMHQVPGKAGPGLLDFGAAGKSYYYSRMRMASQGSLSLGGVSQPVTGQSWFDHQWGDFESTALTWNWFALQLDDGTDIMLFQVFDAQGKPVSKSGTVNRDKFMKLLDADDYQLTSRKNWTSPKSGVTYPVGWDISIPSEKLTLTAKPFTNDCEFNGLETIMKIYWEGPIQIAGSKSGVGYLELSGYQKQRRAD